MERTQLVDEYLRLRREKLGLAEEFRTRMDPICARLKELEAQLDGCAILRCEPGCQTH